jgi:fatty acid desaturase
MAKSKLGEPTRTPDSRSDDARNFRNGCLFLVGIVILLWIAIWIAWSVWPR